MVELNIQTKRKKWVVDIGAFHGDEGRRIKHSLIHEDEYPLLLIEADPSNFSKIEPRSGEKKLNLAIAPHDGWVEFHRYKPETGSILPIDSAALDNYIDGHTGNRALSDDWHLRGKVRVLSRRLDTLIMEEGIEHIRFLKIDAQGYDLEVIQSLGEKMGIVDELVCEVQLPGAQIYKNSACKKDILDYLRSRGFLFIRQKYQSYGQELNLYFKRKDLCGGWDQEPLVSVLTPCYNSAKYLEKCIQSVMGQEYPYYEHIIQDGGSTDETLQILEKYKQHVSWASEKDYGQSDGLNRALQRCKGDIIGVLNADDEYASNALFWAVEHFYKNSESGVIYGDQHNIDEYGNILFTSEGPEPYDFEKIVCCEAVIPAQAAFVRRTAMMKAGFYVDASRKTCPDYEMWVRLGLTTQMKHVPGVIARYRIHSGSEGQRADVVFKMAESKLEVIDRLVSAESVPDKIKKLRRRARAGILEWSAGHFLPPHIINSPWCAWRQLFKAYFACPSRRLFMRLTVVPLFRMTGLDGFSLEGLNNNLRGKLRKLDECALGGAIYRYWYYPRKTKKAEKKQ